MPDQSACVDEACGRLLDKAFDLLQAAATLLREQNASLSYSVGVLCHSAIENIEKACYLHDHSVVDASVLCGQVSFLVSVDDRRRNSLNHYNQRLFLASDWHVLLTPDWQDALALQTALSVIDVIADHMPDVLHEIYCGVLKNKHIA